MLSMNIFHSLNASIWARKELSSGGLLVDDFMEDSEGGFSSVGGLMDKGNGTPRSPVIRISINGVNTVVYGLEAGGGAPTSLRVEFML